MSSTFYDETGLKFLQRSKSKPLSTFNLPIIDDLKQEILSGCIIEVYSPVQAFGTETLLTTIANCILSEEESGIPLGGQEMIVFYFDIDFKFNVWRFIQILEENIKEAVEKHFEKSINRSSSFL
jgi:hypothetical protein